MSLSMGSSNCVHCGKLVPNNCGNCPHCDEVAFLHKTEEVIKFDMFGDIEKDLRSKGWAADKNGNWFKEGCHINGKLSLEGASHLEKILEQVEKGNFT